MESLFATFFPGDCRICSDPLLNISRLPVCTDCLTKIKPFQGSQCDICGELLVSRNFQGEEQGSPLCGLCQQVRPTYIRAVSGGPYEGVLRDLVHLLKYDRVQTTADILGKTLADAIAPLFDEVGPNAVIIPVPLHNSKHHQRGFNQSERVAMHAVRALGKEFRAELIISALQRKRATTSQTGLTRHQRRLNVRGAFAVNPLHKRIIAGRNVILVDDVFTTGTTAQECARVLVRAGAAQVWVATIARVSRLEPFSALEVSQIGQEEAASAATGNAIGGEF
ncbi:MAG: phosphoribosyltransferase [Acidobacteriales bacterium]|nr:phosphoribosyltransferase [Terriglobales bacterium]